MTFFTWIGIVTSSFIGATILLVLFKWISRQITQLQWKYYGRPRIQELYDFMSFARENKIASVQKYAQADPLTKFIFVRVALYQLKKY